jgi:glycosyltransferase involved in cell wall biosynthesis
MNKEDAGILLSIAIPTWNRATLLEKALKNVGEQAGLFKNEIEIIISNNDSSDNTMQVMNEFTIAYPNLIIKTYHQESNTGYYGNFKKVRELSIGKYFWLLSDNEYLKNNAISIIINLIRKQQNVGVFYINNKIDPQINTEIKFEEAKKYFDSENAYQITLISSAIMLNNKQYDDEITTRYNNNLFMGFLYLINALRVKNKICTINSNLFSSEPAFVSFDVFAAWTFHILNCVNYMLEIELLNTYTKEKFISGYLKTNVKNHIIAFRKGIKTRENTYTLNDLRTLIENHYKHNKTYNKKVRPYLFSHFIIFYLFIFATKSKKAIAKVFFSKL